MKGFIRRFFNALKPCAGLVQAPKFKASLSLSESRGHGHASASGRLVTRGSIAMSRCPMMSEEEIEARREKILHYDFSSFMSIRCS